MSCQLLARKRHIVCCFIQTSQGYPPVVTYCDISLMYTRTQPSDTCYNIGSSIYFGIHPLLKEFKVYGLMNNLAMFVIIGEEDFLQNCFVNKRRKINFQLVL